MEGTKLPSTYLLSGLSLFSYMLSTVSMAASVDGQLPFLAACYCTYYPIVTVCFLLG